jgi:hypothetical protein
LLRACLSLPPATGRRRGEREGERCKRLEDRRVRSSDGEREMGETPRRGRRRPKRKKENSDACDARVIARLCAWCAASASLTRGSYPASPRRGKDEPPGSAASRHLPIPRAATPAKRMVDGHTHLVSLKHSPLLKPSSSSPRLQQQQTPAGMTQVAKAQPHQTSGGGKQERKKKERTNARIGTRN